MPTDIDSDLFADSIGEDEYCRIKKITPRTARKDRQRGIAPPYFIDHRKPRYWKSGIIEDQKARTITPRKTITR